MFFRSDLSCSNMMYDMIEINNCLFLWMFQCLENPVRTNQIPRQIPEQSIYTQPLPGIIMGGVLPFGCIFIQLFFILNSIWSSHTYYMFGFLFLVFLILVVTCSETTILLCYFHLCAEVTLLTF